MKKEQFAPWELDDFHAAPDKEKVFPVTMLLCCKQWKMLHKRIVLPNQTPRKTMHNRATGRPVALFGGDQTAPMPKI
jgi:hypothetical protein